MSPARQELLRLLATKSFRLGEFKLSSGGTSDYYIDCRTTTLNARGSRLTGEVFLEEIRFRGWRPRAVGGLTLGADPVATAMMHAAHTAGRTLDAFVVRKEGKAHGLQRRIEGPDVAGRRVLAVEDTSTTGNSVLTAVDALREAGAEVVGVAVIVERGARQLVTERGLPYRAAYELADLGLD
jgi:orotate phosphoribosyltransferase